MPLRVDHLRVQIFERIKTGLRALTFQWISEHEKSPKPLTRVFLDDNLVLLGIAHGSFEGAVDWMIAKLGTRTAYEILQRRADALALDVHKEGESK